MSESDMGAFEPGPTISMSMMAEKTNIPDGSGPYNLDWLLGGGEYLPGVPVGPGLHEAFTLMMGRLAASGSSLSVEEGKAVDNMGENSTFLRALQPLLSRVINPDRSTVIPEKLFDHVEQTPRMVYYEGGYDLEKMDGLTYFGLHLLLSMSGGNIDIHGYDKMGDIKASNERLFSLIRATDMYMIMGFNTRIWSQLTYYGRFTTHHLENEGNTMSGGVNVMCLPEKWKDKHTTILSLRKNAQTGELAWLEGKGMVAKLDKEAMKESVSMTGEPENVGEWLNYTVRALRLVAIHGPEALSIDIKSFLDKMPKDTTISFESAVGIVSNMMVAYWHSPHEVGRLMRDLKLERFFNKGEYGAMRQGMEVAEMELFGSLRDREDEVYAGWDTREKVKGFVRMSDMTDLIIRFLPVSVEELERLAPSPHDREKIICRMGGNNGTIPSLNPDARSVYRVGDKMVEATRTVMDAKIALDEIIAYARKHPGFATKEQIQAMRKDSKLMWRGAQVKEREDVTPSVKTSIFSGANVAV